MPETESIRMDPEQKQSETATSTPLPGLSEILSLQYMLKQRNQKENSELSHVSKKQSLLPLI